MAGTDRLAGLLQRRRESTAAAGPDAPASQRPGVLNRIRAARQRDLRRSDVAPGGALQDNDSSAPVTPVGSFDHGASPAMKEAASAPPVVVAPSPARPKLPNPYRLAHLRPLTVLARLSKDFGKLDWATWEPENLWHSIVDKYGSEPSRAGKDLIGALRSVLASEAFWHEPHVFLWTCAALNGRMVDFRSYPELEPAEVLYAVAVVEQIRGHEPITLGAQTLPGVAFGEEVDGAVAALFLQNGMVYVPPPLSGADQQVVAHLDSSVVPLHDRVRAAWAELGSKAVPKLTDDDLGVQLSRLFFIREYMKERERA